MADGKSAEYFFKLMSLVVDIGTDGLRKVFEKHIPEEQTIANYLISQKTTIEGKKNCFNDSQLSIITALYPDQSALDISLLSVLIQELTNIQPPIGGWQTKCLIPTDESPGANIKRLRSIRNEVLAHRGMCALTESEFETHWAETENALLGLAGYISGRERMTVKQKIDEAKTKLIIPSQAKCECLLEILRKWKKEENEIERRLEKVENKVTVIDDMQGQLDQTAAAVDNLRRQLDEKMPCRIEEPPEFPFEYPNALTDEDIREYSRKLGKDRCMDWEIFGVFLGYKQTQMNELRKAYSNQIQRGFYEMLKNWHNVVARHNENPRELLAAAFIGIHDDETAEKILGPKLEGVKKLKPKPETEEEMQNKTFDAGKSEVTINIGGKNSVNTFPGSTVNFSGNNVF